MIKTICVSNQKGGSGKTTTTMNLAAALAAKGKKALIMDADGQANMTTAFGINPDDIEEKRGSVFHLITGKKTKTADFVIPTGVENLDLIPSCQVVFNLEQELNMMIGREYKIDKALKQIKDDYDYIFIDTPPSLGHISFNAFLASDGIIVVYNATTFSTDGISQLVKTVYKIYEEDININDTEIIGCVWNDYDSRYKKMNDKVENNLKDADALGKRFPAIPRAAAIVQAQEAHQPINLFDTKHKATLQYAKFADELLKLSSQATE